MEASKFPRSKYSAYFEKVETDDGIVARVYQLPSGAPLVHTFNGHAEANEWIEDTMADFVKEA